MTHRLPLREGEWIDRSRPVEFRFEGIPYQGYQGDVLTSALWANGLRLLGRSFKYHRPRGVYSLANADVNVMVQTADRTNLRGDTLSIYQGLDAQAVNTLGGLRHDWLGFIDWFGSFLPAGFYYKAFHTPRWLFPFYERRIRKIAGLGRITKAGQAEKTPKACATCDLLVVGAGPAGLSAAIAGAEQGLRVILVDEQPQTGGSLLWQRTLHANAGQTLLQLRQQCKGFNNLEIRCGTQAGGWYADNWIALFDQERLIKVRAGAVVVASGCIEQPAAFANNDLPGVMLASAAQRLIHLYAVKPGDRCVVVATNVDGYAAALDLHEAGVKVAAIADLRQAGEPGAWTGRVATAGIKVLNGHTVYEAIPGPRKASVKGARLLALDPEGHFSAATPTDISCDCILMSVGWAPNADLLYQAGGRFAYAAHVEQFIPETLPPTIFAAGRVNGVFDLEARLTDGRRAGLAAAQLLGRYHGPIPETPTHTGLAPSHPYPIFPHTKKKCFVDLDEDVHFSDIANAHQEGYDNIELLKRYTAVGMGPSQGKLANMNAIRILARLNGKSIRETGVTTSRPFHHPVSMAHLAGRRFHPVRRTPMHDWHVQAGAVFTHVGAWLRPEYYPQPGRDRQEVIVEEALNVRRSVGLIDIGTLGKIEVNGPDAASFLERIYTSRFARLVPGKLTYAVACDESGVLIEDGLVARLTEDRFYVTATTTGVGAFFQEMQRWAILWGSNVVLVNATSHWSAMNLAGPRARQVLSQFTDINLAPDSFPYLAVREGSVAGVKARVLRVGFVGELGYEIHVPAGAALKVWSALMETATDLKVRPFGVEAQRLLRLEKGHLIIGQDTDALTNPLEGNLEWALGKHKPFFVGQRSLAIVKGQPLARRLVGIAFPPNHAGPLPEECHLIVESNEIVGRITSMAPHSTLGHALGLAFIRPDLATPGKQITIRGEGGRAINAEVVRLPFYDPDNERQLEAHELQHNPDQSRPVSLSNNQAGSALELRNITLQDLYARRKLGIKGPGAKAWLRGQGIEIPPGVYDTRNLGTDSLIARLGSNDFLLEGGAGSDLVDHLSAGLAGFPPQVYSVERQDHTYLLKGELAPAVLAQVCSIDLRSVPESRLILTRVAGMNCAVLPDRTDNGPRFRLWVDPSFADFFWEILTGVCRDVGCFDSPFRLPDMT